MVSINIHRLGPETEAIAGVRKILNPDFSPSALQAALDGMATRAVYPPAVAALTRFVRAKRGDSPLVAILVDPTLSRDVRARRVAQAVALFKRDEADGLGFAFGYTDLVAATRTAPLARLALACLGYILDPEGAPFQYEFGEPWPPARRERAALALHFLTRRAFRLKRGAP